MSVHFEDNSVRVKSAMEQAAIAYLHEAAMEITSQTKNNMPNGHWYSQQKTKWKYIVDESKLEATIGNPMQQSLWTEFGTGEYAIHGDGRKGYWVYVKGDDDSNASSKGGKEYTLADAKKIVAMMRADGIDAHYTKGQTPKRPLENAFNSLKNALIKRAEEVLKAKLEG